MSTPAICTIRGCTGLCLARGWCEAHYRRWRRHGDPRGGIHVRVTCRVQDCPAPHDARGLCATHYARWRRHGDPLWEPLREVDEIAVERAVSGERPGRLTTGEREEIVRRLHRMRWSDGRIAGALDIGATGVQAIRARLGLPAVPPTAQITRRAHYADGGGCRG